MHSAESRYREHCIIIMFNFFATFTVYNEHLHFTVFGNIFFSHSEVLSELQFAFLCFLVGQNYDCFEQWKLLGKIFFFIPSTGMLLFWKFSPRLVSMLCKCGEGLLKYPTLFMDFISDLYFQVCRLFILVYIICPGTGTVIGIRNPTLNTVNISSYQRWEKTSVSLWMEGSRYVQFQSLCLHLIF
jgi:hypothetical protein